MLVIKLLMLNLLFIASFFVLFSQSIWLFSINSALIFMLIVVQLKREREQQQKILHTLIGGLRNLQDGDFSISLAESAEQKKNTSQHQLISLFNQVAEKLREEKQTLYQRELLLDKVVNASDVVTVLINHRNTLIFANRAAHHFFNSGGLLGTLWPELLESEMPELLRHQDKSNAIIELQMNEAKGSGSSKQEKRGFIEQSWHLSLHQLKLHGSSHQLVLLKPITKELHQQELQTWKKIIKVINHELNNSIAPISSMCHSGEILADRLNEPQLNRVFNTISNRVKKLSDFIQSYSQLARLSIPQKKPFDIVQTIKQLQNLYLLELENTESSIIINADEGQLEQLLINLLKNAKEVSPSQASQISVSLQNDIVNINIRDHGPGMAAEVMQKAFLPYYSTKQNGSGIGLSICREVVDAHNGHITLSNHSGGGLQVTLSMPITNN